MNFRLSFITLSSIIVVSSSAFAAEITERYTIVRSGDGYVRTNTATGSTSICTEQKGQLVCRMAADERQAYEADLAEMEGKIDSLEKRVAALEKPGSVMPGAAQSLETEEDFQTSLNRMEQFFRRFMGIVKEFQQFSGDSAPVPDRT